MKQFEIQFELIDNHIQFLIDELKNARQSATGADKQTLSYLSKKADIAGKAIGLALDRIENN